MKKTILTLAMFSGAAAPSTGHGGDLRSDITITPEQSINMDRAISTAKILSEEDAKIAITINGDLSGTVINTYMGERIQPCVDDIREAQASLDVLIQKCYPEGHDPNGKIIASGSYTLREGSYCHTIVLGSSLYVYCQPPLDLGFPRN